MAKARTAAQRAALRKAQLASARKRRKKHKMSGKKKAAIAGAVAALALTGASAYMLDRKHNTMVVYHSTYHARARKIVAEGFKPKHRARAYRNMVNGHLHEAGRLFVGVTRKSSTPYGPALLTARVRKSKFKKLATQDVHSLTIEGEKWGFKSRNGNHYHIQVSDIPKLGLKFKYSREDQKKARNRILDRYYLGPYAER